MSHYSTYVAWKRLTHGGTRSREDMSPTEQAEFDALGTKTAKPLTPEERAEAKRLYLQSTKRRSGPGSAAST